MIKRARKLQRYLPRSRICVPAPLCGFAPALGAAPGLELAPGFAGGCCIGRPDCPEVEGSLAPGVPCELAPVLGFADGCCVDEPA